ncbi:hypothetical protein [Lacrimispora brassicae]
MMDHILKPKEKGIWFNRLPHGRGKPEGSGWIRIQAAQVLHSIRENAVKVNESIVKIDQASVEQAATLRLEVEKFKLNTEK